jgi:hypothetical protein
MNVESGETVDVHPVISQVKEASKNVISDILDEEVELMGLISSYENTIKFEINGYYFL